MCKSYNIKIFIYDIYMLIWLVVHVLLSHDIDQQKLNKEYEKVMSNILNELCINLFLCNELYINLFLCTKKIFKC